MSNMSYCRFQNTLDDLRDCETAIEELQNPKEELSAEEYAAYRALIRMCRRIANDNEGVS